ncbi:MAG TPA: rhodanese-like domain-containing protein [Anaeromyxobacter sp.]
MVSRITPRQVVARMAKGERVTFVDARADEVRKAAGLRLTGAVPVRLRTIVGDAAQVPPQCLVVVYGDGEGDLDVPRVADGLRALGFGDVRVLAGGFAAWLELRYPVQDADGAIAA